MVGYSAQGVFHVSAVQPINYVIEELQGLFDINNKVRARAAGMRQAYCFLRAASNECTRSALPLMLDACFVCC